jgi:hypothetical protein
MQDVLIRRISVGTVFKLVGVGLLFSLLPFTILMGCTAALGLNTLTWNNEPLHGWVALAASPFIGVFFVAIFTMFFGTTTAFGLWVYSWLGPFGISYKPAEQRITPAAHPADAA